MTKRSLIFIRHGQTDANATGLLLGRHDAPLNAVGKAQASAVAEALTNRDRFGNVTGIVTSPLARAYQTAEVIHQTLNLSAEQDQASAPSFAIDDRFIELDYGDYDGHPISSIDQETWMKWQTDPTFTPPGGESLQALHDRVEQACVELISQRWASATQSEISPEDSNHHESLIVVTHVSPLKAALTWSLGVDEQVAWRTFVNNATITVITQNLGRLALVTFNEAAHLEHLKN